MKVFNVAEKPSVAKEISNILSGNKARRRQGFSKYNPIYEFPYQIQNQSVDMIFTSVSGHLMELDFTEEYRGWSSCSPVSLFHAPVRKKVRNDPIQKKIVHTLHSEVKSSQWLILWLDCDREGENIAYEVKSVCEASNRQLHVMRAKFSALIPRDIVNAVHNLVSPNEDLSLACDARSEIDLRIGAAFTRFQTVQIKRKFPHVCKEKGVLSYGPCQFPTLGFVVERYLKILNFQEETFYYISMTHEAVQLEVSHKATFKWKRDKVYDRSTCLCLYEACIYSTIARVVSVEARPSAKNKPLPLTTVELQKRCSKWLHLSSEQTMKAAESLYNKGYISYPRTETSKFKDGTDLRALLELQQEHNCWGRYIKEQLFHKNLFEAPRNGIQDDQAHPPIHPTKCVTLESIQDINEKKLYEFVVLHFLACCSKNAKGSLTTVQALVGTETFMTSGLMILERNYLDIYRYEKWTGNSIPVYQIGHSFIPTTFTMETGHTAPPALLTEADLISKMDSNGIGTDATIADHIKTILKREYAVKVKDNSRFQPTALGLALVQSYERMGLELAKPRLRAEMERDCKAISLGQKDKAEVVATCISQMQEIFTRVENNASLLDQTFAEYLGQTTGTHDLCLICGGIVELGRYNSSRCGSCSTIIPMLSSKPSEQCRSTYHHEKKSNPSCLNDTSNGTNTITTNYSCPSCDKHSVPCIRREAQKESPNQGRFFYCCSLDQASRCDFFMWEDAINNVRNQVVKCSGHDEVCAERRVQKKGPNKNRLFYTCSRPQRESCGYFEWKCDDTIITDNDANENSVSILVTPKCYCGTAAKMLTCSSNANKGKHFFRCGNDEEERCSFFQWK